MFRNSFEKRLRMEMLESKIPMAADLTVAVVNGDLLITGDDAVNHFILEQDDDYELGHYLIRNRGQFDDTVNGQPFTEYYVTGVTRDVIINLGGGDDVLRLTGEEESDRSHDLIIPRDLIVNLGEGHDQFYSGVYENFLQFQAPVTVTRNLHIDGGGGDDSLLTTALSVGNNLNYTDSQGTNSFFNDPTFIYVLARRSDVGGNLNINTGSDIDFMMLEEFDVGGNVSFNVGAGDDVAQVSNFTIGGSVSLGLGSGINEGIVQFTDVNSVVIGGSGANIVRVENVIANSVTVLTGNNNDAVLFNNVTADMTTIATFGGEDYVEIRDSAFDLLIVQLGTGDDNLTLDGVTVDLIAILSGGRGTDSLTGVGDNDINMLIDMGFEAMAGDL
jgi:hypothetical protein